MFCNGNCRDEDKPNSFELWGIYVEPLKKRQGIGTKLVKFCEEEALKRGFTEVCLWVLEKILTPERFMKKWGIMRTERKSILAFWGLMK